MSKVEIVAKEPVAIIGLGCVMPDAPGVAAFWNNILAGKSSIRDVAAERWNPAFHYDTDKSAPDKTYTKIGGFVSDDAFSGLDYRMPPTTVAQIDPVQRWALSATRQALLDAGYKTGLKADDAKPPEAGRGPLREFDRNRCAIILGNAMGGELQKQTSRRVYWPEAAAAVEATPEFQRMSRPDQEGMMRRAQEQFKGELIPVTEDTMPGSLSNVIAGRIANVFDLSGKNFTTDAACASSFAAMDAAVATLQSHESDVVLWGGSDRSMDVSSYIQFSKIGALSPDGSRPFDAGANGFVMGEGCAMFLLKRLADAERDGDKVYAVIRGIGSSSDGKGKGITAPNPAGQVKAVLRAYQDAAIDPATVGLLEAHGTSTPVGDPVELQSVMEAVASLTKSPIPPGSIAVGSVKGNIGHLKAAAGAAGVLKAVLALKHGVLPPTINVKQLNPRIDWAKSPFKVQTGKAEWDRPADHPRRAAVSSFGFGGTNFHIVLEEHIPGRLKVVKPAVMGALGVTNAGPGDPPTTPSTPMAPASGGSASSAHPTDGPARMVIDVPAFAASMKENAAHEAEPLVLDGAAAPQAAAEILQVKVDFPTTGSGKRLRDCVHPYTTKGLVAETRVATSIADPSDLAKKLDLAQKAAANPAQARLAFQQGVFLGKGKPKGKVAFLFPGQGTQYVNMMRDLAAKYEVVRNTFEEADQVLLDELDGVRLTDILWPTPNTPEAQAASEKKLQLTEFTQPAVLAADVAVFRLMRQWGVEAHVVAGHSLGEYGALVAAGVLSFADALHAVAARGREMAHVEVPDLGKMASVSSGWHAVTEAIQSVTEYVIPANKNCPSQTVIAGSSKGVDQAVALLQAKGLQVQYLPVSAAFHSAIVAPASKPLRNVLSRLGVTPPKIRVLSNVGAQPYQDDVEWILDNLATQVASPVEWIGIIERMYDEGVRTFIEVGPKLALTNFVRDILKEKPDAVAIGSNHPKKGGIVHVNELFAFLGAWGFKPKLPALDDPAVYTREFRDPAARFRTAAKSPVSQTSQMATTSEASGSTGTRSGGDARLDALLRMADDLRRLVEQERSGTAPAAVPSSVASPASPEAVEAEVRRRLSAFGFNLDDIGVSGISVGLPGTSKPLFADDNFDRILRGENLIDTLPEGERRKIVDKNVVRLSKGSDGSAQFQVVSDIAQVIQLAGRRGGFDIAHYGVGKELADSLDRTFQYAIAAGIEALRDAGIPLQRTYVQTSQGGYLPKEWKLPASLQDGTGIVFASAFPGYDNLLRDVSRYLADKYAGRSLDDMQALYGELIGLVSEDSARAKLQDAFDEEFKRLQDALPGHGASRYEFNRKFLFNVLSMGHSQLAQFIGARGPNTQVNAACASTTQGIAIAEDWIRTGRAKRVLVVGADDVTSDAMFEWIGAGFLASGAATTKAKIEEAALPFDKRRHGMIVGMGAVGLVIESVPEVTARGMRPIARLLATKVSNSAFHGSRLDVAHIASEMQAVLAAAGARYGIRPEAIAAQTIFMSHETYTPARGGSASAEIHALRATFGPNANKVVVANTKGFTGHPQGAGIEDAIVLKCLQRGQVPPIANFRDPDPELGDLNLSKGGRYDVKYALRLAAGFGSQVAMSLTELVAKESERIADPDQYQRWLVQMSGFASAKTEIVNRTLRIVDQGAPKTQARAAAPIPAVVATAPQGARESTQRTPETLAAASSSQESSESSEARSSSGGASEEQVLAKLIDIVAGKTGYPKDLLDPNLDMEADLGIDTVKQAELFGAIRDVYGLPQEQNIQIKDYPTLRKVAGYVVTRLGSGAKVHASGVNATSHAREILPAAAAMTASARAVESSSPHPEAMGSQGVPVPPSTSLPSADVLAKLIGLVAVKTGYPPELLDPNLDMEADLGIDTVKQAELFGAIRDVYGLPLEQDIQIKDYPTLTKVAGYVQSRLGGAPSTSEVGVSPRTQSHAAEQQVVPPAVPAGMVSSGSSGARGRAQTPGGQAPDAVLHKVIQLVATKTGYPADMLEPDLDMEADLGIDTVKQAEIFGEVRSMFGIAPIDGLLLKDYPTLRKVAGFVLQNVDGEAAATPIATPAGAPALSSTSISPQSRSPSQPPTSVTPPSPTTSPTTTTSIRSPVAATSRPASKIVRRAPSLRPVPLPNEPNTLQRGTVLLVGDQDKAMIAAFERAGYAVKPSVPTGEQPVGILALALHAGPPATARVGDLFDSAKANRSHFGAGAFVCVVTRQDGAHGLHTVRDAGMAAMAGLAKALKKELPQAVTKAIDLSPDTLDGANLVLAELLHGGTRTEVCYDGEGIRNVIDVAPHSLPDALPAVEGKHLVVSGGAQGITVELLAALAPQNPSLLLLGRTEVPAEAAEWAQLDDAGWKAKEQEAIAALKAQGGKVTPVTIQKALSPLQKAAEVHRNLHRLQVAGAQVLYAPVDVTDAAGVEEAVAWARGLWGRIDGVLHAAGIEISKDLASKDRAQFDQVFGIKVKGWEALMNATRDDKLEFLGAFSSVAGRFGNIGQTDYSSANEFLAKAVKHEAGRRKVPTAFTIAWGPWGEVGMATKGSIMQIMESTGVTPIPTVEGTRHFLNEMAAPGIRECVVAGQLGAIDADGQIVDKAWNVAVEVANRLLSSHAKKFRLLSTIDACVPDESLEATVVVDQKRDPGLRDHKVDGVPYLPGVFGLEAFAEAGSLLAARDAVFIGAEDVRFASPLKQLKDAPVRAQLSARVSSSEKGVTKVACRLTTRFIGPDGQVHGEPRLHFEGTVLFGPPRSSDLFVAAPRGDRSRTRATIYPPFFHGPSFQVLENAGPFGAEAVAEFRDPVEPHFEAGEAQFQGHPMLIEALFQVCGLATLVRDSVMSLPAGIMRVEHFHQGTLPAGIRLVGRPTGKDAQGLRTFDAQAVGPDGSILVRLTGYAMVETGPAPGSTPSTASTPSHAGGPTPPSAPASSPAATTGAASPSAAVATPPSAATTTPLPGADVNLPQIEDVHFAAIKVEHRPAEGEWFTPREREKHASFPAPKRADEWRAGRLAVKKAVMDTHPGLTAQAIEIHADEKSGRPRLLVAGQESALWVSITHRDGLAVAAVSPAPLGIDLETIEDRARSFLEESFSVPELKTLLEAADPRVDAACMWAAKEAAFKRAGVGLKADLRAHQVTAHADGGAIVAGPSGRFGVRFFELERKVLAVTTPQYDVLEAVK